MLILYTVLSCPAKTICFRPWIIHNVGATSLVFNVQFSCYCCVELLAVIFTRRLRSLIDWLTGCFLAFAVGQQLTTFNHQSKIFVGANIDSSGKLVRTFRGSLAGPVWVSHILQLRGSLNALHVKGSRAGECLNGWNRCFVSFHLIVQTIPSYRLSSYGRRALSVAGPITQNSLPRNLRDPVHVISVLGPLLKYFPEY